MKNTKSTLNGHISYHSNPVTFQKCQELSFICPSIELSIGLAPHLITAIDIMYGYIIGCTAYISADCLNLIFKFWSQVKYLKSKRSLK